MAAAFATAAAALLTVAARTVPPAAAQSAPPAPMPPSPPPSGWTGTWLLSVTDGASAEAACELAEVRAFVQRDVEFSHRC